MTRDNNKSERRFESIFFVKGKKKKIEPRFLDGKVESRKDEDIRETEATWHKEIGIKRKKEKEKSDGGRFCELELT